jgi:hypothetical protein
MRLASYRRRPPTKGPRGQIPLAQVKAVEDDKDTGADDHEAHQHNRARTEEFAHDTHSRSRPWLHGDKYTRQPVNQF